MGPRRESEMSKLHKIAISESIDVNISSGLCVGEFQNVFKTSSPYLLHRSYVVSFLFSQVRITLDHNTGTQSDLKNFQELTEIWISSHSENVRGVRARSARISLFSFNYSLNSMNRNIERHLRCKRYSNIGTSQG